MKAIPLILLLAFLLSLRLFFFNQERHVFKENEVFNQTYSFTHEAKENSYGQYFFVDNILVSVPLFPKYYYGDKIQISGKITSLKTGKGSMLTIKSPTVKSIKERSPFIAVSKFVRGRIESVVLTTIPMKEGGLLLGIILGVRDKIDNDFYQQLKNSGVLHVIAASGQNVSIVASLLLSLLQKVVKRRLALLFTGLAVIFYAFIAGFDPSIVRAAIMALITFGALLFGRQSKGLYALFATGWIMVFQNPQMVENVSFQLSFLSTFGILTIKPLLDRISMLRILSFLKDDLTTTLSAQIATFPLILTVFGSYSLVSLPVNILLLWTVPILMIFGGIGALASLALPLLSIPFVLISYPFLLYFTSIISVSSEFKAGFAVQSLPITVAIGYYLILIAVVVKYKGGERGKF